MKTELYVIHDKAPSLEELQKLVGGYIQIVIDRFGEQLIVNEEGVLMGLPYNRKATELLNSKFNVQDFIVGDAVLLKINARIS